MSVAALVPLRRLVASLDNGVWGEEAIMDGTDVQCIRAADFNFSALKVTTERAPFRAIPSAALSRLRLRRGDIVVEKSGGGDGLPVGRAVLFDLEVPAVCSNFAARLRPRPGVDPHFLTYALATAYWQGATEKCIKQTTGIQNLDTGEWLRTLTPNPPTAEQRRIVDFLDDQVTRIDAAMYQREGQIELLEERHLAALHRTLLHPDDRLAMLRRLGVTLTTGPFGTAFAASQYADRGVPMINPVHIKDGVLTPGDGHSVSESTASTLRRHWLGPGDIVTGRKGDLGRSAVVAEHQAGWICGSDAIAIRPDSGRLLSAFLDACLHLSATRQDLLARSLATTMPSLNEDMLLSVRVPVLSLQEQQSRAARAGAVAASHRSLIKSCRAANALLQERKRALVTAAVTGEFDVSAAGSRAAAAVTA